MDNIEVLLNDLNNMAPISIGFRKDLAKVMKEKKKKDGYIFLKPGQITNKAWQVLSGFIVVTDTDAREHEIVKRIYFPRQIVADLRSFFEKAHVVYKYIAVGETNVLEIEKAGFSKLKKYEETNLLVQHISFSENEIMDNIAYMLRIPESERVKMFLETYKVDGLPYWHCASLLNMREIDYINYKVALETNGMITVSSGTENDTEAVDTNSAIPYKIKAFVFKHYAESGFGNNNEIAKVFNLTTTTLKRKFVRAFGLSVSRFILETRMEFAYSLLLNGCSVSETASKTGYKTIYHFSKEFKKYYGYPPTVIKIDKGLNIS